MITRPNGRVLSIVITIAYGFVRVRNGVFLYAIETRFSSRKCTLAFTVRHDRLVLNVAEASRVIVDVASIASRHRVVMLIGVFAECDCLMIGVELKFQITFYSFYVYLFVFTVSLISGTLRAKCCLNGFRLQMVTAGKGAFSNAN